MNKLLLIVLWLALPANLLATNYSLDLRHSIIASDKDLTAYGVAIRELPLWNTRASAGARLATAGFGVRSLHCAGELAYSATSFLSLHTRLHQGVDTDRWTSLTHLAAFAELHADPFASLGAYFALGWYERWSRVDRGLPFPTFSSSFREHDFLLRMGIVLRPHDHWQVALSAATYEEIEIENLNNPFGEIRVFHLPRDSTISGSAYFRYRLSLGFGRWDSLTFGFALTLKEPPEADKSLQMRSLSLERRSNP